MKNNSDYQFRASKLMSSLGFTVIEITEGLGEILPLNISGDTPTEMLVMVPVPTWVAACTQKLDHLDLTYTLKVLVLILPVQDIIQSPVQVKSIQLK